MFFTVYVSMLRMSPLPRPRTLPFRHELHLPSATQTGQTSMPTTRQPDAIVTPIPALPPPRLRRESRVRTDLKVSSCFTTGGLRHYVG